VEVVQGFLDRQKGESPAPKSTDHSQVLDQTLLKTILQAVGNCWRMWQDESLNDSRSAVKVPGASRARDWVWLSLRPFSWAPEAKHCPEIAPGIAMDRARIIGLSETLVTANLSRF